ncbi:MAG: hypothetical protein RSB20_01615 [Clostridia bacterium]
MELKNNTNALMTVGDLMDILRHQDNDTVVAFTNADLSFYRIVDKTLDYIDSEYLIADLGRQDFSYNDDDIKLLKKGVFTTFRGCKVSVDNLVKVLLLFV